LPWAHVGKRPCQPAFEYWPRLLLRVTAELGQERGEVAGRLHIASFGAVM